MMKIMGVLLTNAINAEVMQGLWVIFGIETFLYAVWSILYGLFLFNVVGGEKRLDCFARPLSDYPLFPGDESSTFQDAENITEKFNLVLAFGFYANVIALCVFMPLKCCALGQLAEKAEFSLEGVVATAEEGMIDGNDTKRPN